MNNIETRLITTELRANTEDRSVQGYAAVYDSESHQLGWFKEIIEPGAFERALERSPDIVARFNHDDNIILGRTTAGTLEVRADEKGLYYIIPDMPKSREDILEGIQRGDISKSSFAFTVESDRWEERNGETFRYISEFNTIYDVAPVTSPAYPDTSVAKRSFEGFVQEQLKEEQTLRTKAYSDYMERKLTLIKLFL